MIDLKGFRKTNKLSQKDVAEAVGCSRSFIGQVESGFSKLPDDKLRKLIANTKGWDVTCLIEREDTPEDSDGKNGTRVNISELENEVAKVLALQKEAEMLRAQIEDLKAQNEKYWKLIEKLTEK